LAQETAVNNKNGWHSSKNLFHGIGSVKKIFSIFLLLFLLAACTSNTATPEVLSNEAQIATIVAATLSAMPSFTPVPSLTSTDTPTPTNTPQPYYSYQNPEFGFECLYPLDVTYRMWEGWKDLLFSMSFNRPSYKNRGQSPEVSIAIYDNPDNLPLKQWVAAHIARGEDDHSSVVNYDYASEIKELSIDGHSAIIFIASAGMVPDSPRLLIAKDQHILGITEVSWGPWYMRDIFLTVASSIKFSQSTDALSIDNSVKETLESALNSLSQ
jgi:hypothetical protein